MLTLNTNHRWKVTGVDLSGTRVDPLHTSSYSEADAHFREGVHLGTIYVRQDDRWRIVKRRRGYHLGSTKS